MCHTYNLELRGQNYTDISWEAILHILDPFRICMYTFEQLNEKCPETFLFS